MNECMGILIGLVAATFLLVLDLWVAQSRIMRKIIHLFLGWLHRG